MHGVSDLSYYVCCDFIYKAGRNVCFEVKYARLVRSWRYFFLVCGATIDCGFCRSIDRPAWANASLQGNKRAFRTCSHQSLSIICVHLVLNSQGIFGRRAPHIQNHRPVGIRWVIVAPNSCQSARYVRACTMVDKTVLSYTWYIIWYDNKIWHTMGSFFSLISSTRHS